MAMMTPPLTEQLWSLSLPWQCHGLPLRCFQATLEMLLSQSPVELNSVSAAKSYIKEVTWYS